LQNYPLEKRGGGTNVECETHTPCTFSESGYFQGVATEAGDVEVDTEEGEALVVEPEVGAWFS
jgi:hypothetical protein